MSRNWYEPPDPVIFPCPIGKCSNEDCPANISACDSFEAPENDDEVDECIHCTESEEMHHDCVDEADKAGVFDAPEREDDRF